MRLLCFNQFELFFFFKNNVRTTAEDHFQDVRLLTLDADCAKWNPGDIFCVRPRNLVDRVNRLFEIFEEHSVPIFPEMMVSLSEIDSGKWFQIIKTFNS